MSASRDGAAPTTPAITKLVDESLSQDTNLSDAYERMRAALRGVSGIVNPPTEADRLYSRRDAFAAPAPAQSAEPPTCFRVLYLHGNDRMEIFGASEAHLRASYE